MLVQIKQYCRHNVKPGQTEEGQLGDGFGVGFLNGDGDAE